MHSHAHSIHTDPGAIRQEKLKAVAKELGIEWGRWTDEEYFIICELAGVFPEYPPMR